MLRPVDIGRSGIFSLVRLALVEVEWCFLFLGGYGFGMSHPDEKGNVGEKNVIFLSEQTYLLIENNYICCPQSDYEILMDEKFVVNIGRQLGSGGREVGERLASRLGIDFYDKELIQLASEDSGLCREFFEKADEKASKGIMGGLFGMRFQFVSESAIPITNCLSNDALFKVQSDVIRRLAAEKSCVFVGRCADYILRDHPRCVNVFISASREERIARLRRLHSISEERAEEMMEKADKKRSEYYNYYSNKTWGMASTYHLCVDSSALGIEKTIDFVEEFVKLKIQ